jgi:hypothetical protein
MYVGFVTRELLDQSAAVRVTGTQGFDGETPRGKPFGRPKRRWECIKMGLKEIWESVEHWWNIPTGENQSDREETCPKTNLSTKSPA